MTRSCAVLTLAMVLALLAGTGCKPSGPSLSSPDGTILTVSKQLSENQPGIIWDALPPSYQGQLQDDLIRAFAEKMDPDVYGKASGVLRKAVGILRDKREFVLPALMTNQMVRMANLDRAKIEQNWDQVVGLLETVVNSELSDLEQLKTLDVGQFLKGTGSSVMQQLSALSALSEDDPYNTQFKTKLSQIQVEVVRSGGDQATVKTTVPGEDPETVFLVKVEGRWLPQDMVTQWDDWMQKAKTQIGGMNQESMQKSKPMIMGVLSALETSLDQLSKAKTASEFNQRLKDLMASLPIPGQTPTRPKPRR